LTSAGARFLYGPLLAAALVGAIVLDERVGSRLALWALVGTFCLMGQWEFYGMCRGRGHRPAEVAGTWVVAVAFVLRPVIEGPLFFAPVIRWPGAEPFPWSGLGPSDAAPLIFVYRLLPLVLAGWVAFKLVLRRETFDAVDAALTVAGAGYVGLLLLLPEVWSARGVAWAPEPLWMLLFLAAANKLSDTFAYLVGSRFGRHKMCPSVSPGKTWEGAVAGLVAGTAGGAFFLAWPRGVSMLDPLLIGAAAAVTMAAQMGDLVESAVKRWAQVKDSGAILPGLGGALDVIDSFLISVPMTYLLFMGAGLGGGG
jgi:CDP-diglyceride synthetase